MDLLKGLEVYLFVDKFQREAIKDVGFLCGLHSKLTNWNDLNDKLEEAIKNKQQDRPCLFEVYQKTVWAQKHDCARERIKMFAVKGKVRQSQTLQRIMKAICNVEHILGKHVTFINTPGNAENDQIKWHQLVNVHLEEEAKQTAIFHSRYNYGSSRLPDKLQEHLL